MSCNRNWNQALPRLAALSGLDAQALDDIRLAAQARVTRGVPDVDATTAQQQAAQVMACIRALGVAPPGSQHGGVDVTLPNGAVERVPAKAAAVAGYAAVGRALLAHPTPAMQALQTQIDATQQARLDATLAAQLQSVAQQILRDHPELADWSHPTRITDRIRPFGQAPRSADGGYLVAAGDDAVFAQAIRTLGPDVPSDVQNAIRDLHREQRHEAGSQEHWTIDALADAAPRRALSHALRRLAGQAHCPACGQFVGDGPHRCVVRAAQQAFVAGDTRRARSLLARALHLPPTLDGWSLDGAALTRGAAQALPDTDPDPVRTLVLTPAVIDQISCADPPPLPPETIRDLTALATRCAEDRDTPIPVREAARVVRDLPASAGRGERQGALTAFVTVLAESTGVLPRFTAATDAEAAMRRVLVRDRARRLRDGQLLTIGDARPIAEQWAAWRAATPQDAADAAVVRDVEGALLRILARDAASRSAHDLAAAIRTIGGPPWLVRLADAAPSQVADTLAQTLLTCPHSGLPRLPGRPATDADVATFTAQVQIIQQAAAQGHPDLWRPDSDPTRRAAQVARAQAILTERPASPSGWRDRWQQQRARIGAPDRLDWTLALARSDHPALATWLDSGQEPAATDPAGQAALTALIQSIATHTARTRTGIHADVRTQIARLHADPSRPTADLAAALRMQTRLEHVLTTHANLRLALAAHADWILDDPTGWSRLPVPVQTQVAAHCADWAADASLPDPIRRTAQQHRDAPTGDTAGHLITTILIMHDTAHALLHEEETP